MMIFMHFTFQSIFLSVGFGVGYWLLITANTQEDNLKILGKVLGTILITMVILFSIFSFYYSTKFLNPEYMPVRGMPVINNGIHPENIENKTIQKHNKETIMENQNSDEMEDALPEYQGH